MADGNEGSHSNGSPDSSSSDGGHEYATKLQPMTAKGIKRLCSELLDIKKASEEDFSRNVYSCYSGFVRTLEEISCVNYDIKDLEHYVLNQSNLVQDLFNSLYLEKASDDSTKTKAEDEDFDLCFATEIESQVSEALDTLDIFLSEQKLHDGIILLEMMTKTSKNMNMKEQFTPMIASYLFAISDRRNKIVKQLILLAEHPRVPQPELQKALTGLCRLGEHHQANLLLVKFYHMRLQRHMRELISQKKSLYHSYLYEVAKVVFSVISQAAKCFILLYGETCPYAPEFMVWATEEIEEFMSMFDVYVKSILEINEKFQLVVEAVNCAFSLCSLLRSQKLFLLPDLLNCLRPCMENVLCKRVDQYRKVASILADNETWVLGKFLLSEMTQVMPCLPEDVGEREYFLLTNSGRKFLTLVQAIVDDFSSLISFEMESSFSQGLAVLVDEYICPLERAIQCNNLASCGQGIISIPRLEQQLLLLVNISTFVDLFPIITDGIFSNAKPRCSSLEKANMASQELCDLVLSIEEAADRQRNNFCQQLVYEVMSRGSSKSKPIWKLNSETNNQCTTGSKQDHLMPSPLFQELFKGLKKLETISKCIFTGKHRMVDKLLKQLIVAIVVWLSNNKGLQKKTEDSLVIQECCWIMQVHVDIHFLLEIARLGGCLSDNLVGMAMDKLREIDATITESASDMNGLFSILSDDRCVKDAVKLAIEKLQIQELFVSQLKEEHLGIKVKSGLSQSVKHDATGTSVDFTDQDDVCEDSAEEHFTKPNPTELEYLDKPIAHIEACGKGHARDVKTRKDQYAVFSSTKEEKYSEVEGKENNDWNFIYRLDASAVTEIRSETQKQLDNAAINTELLKVSNEMNANPVYLNCVEAFNVAENAEGNSFDTAVEEIELDPEKKCVVLQTGVSSNSIVETDFISCSSSEEMSNHE